MWWSSVHLFRFKMNKKDFSLFTGASAGSVDGISHKLKNIFQAKFPSCLLVEGGFRKEESGLKVRAQRFPSF